MEQLNTILSIVASALSITATLVALQNKSEIKKLSGSYNRNKQKAKGNSNIQVMGHNNRNGFQ